MHPEDSWYELLDEEIVRAFCAGLMDELQPSYKNQLYIDFVSMDKQMTAKGATSSTTSTSEGRFYLICKTRRFLGFNFPIGYGRPIFGMDAQTAIDGPEGPGRQAVDLWYFEPALMGNSIVQRHLQSFSEKNKKPDQKIVYREMTVFPR